MTEKTIDDTLSQRGGRYGKAEWNAQTIDDLMHTIERGKAYKEWTPMHRQMVHMIMSKISRMVNGDPMYVDNVHDIVGYATLLEDFLTKIEKGEVCQS